MSNFYGLEIARKSLFASQRAIELTGHNIANANTEGYTRQRVDFKAAAPGNGSSIDNFSGNRTGGGVEIEGIVQIRNEYYDTLYREEDAYLSELNAKSESLRYIEDIFSESTESGIGSGIENLFSSMEQLFSDAGNSLLRSQLQQDAISLTNTMQLTAGRLNEYVDRQNSQVETIVSEINSIARQISSLNKTIFSYELNGEPANDLRDQRNLLIDELNSYIAVNVNEKETGELRVSVGGIALVDHMQINNMVLKEEPSPALDGKSVLNPQWEKSGNDVTLTGGELKGLLDIRDSDDEKNPGIPYFMKKLDTLAASMVEEFNEINSGGYTMPYGTTDSRTGVNFFDPTKTTAATISLSDELLEDASNIAASSGPVADYSNWGNNENLELFLELRDVDSIAYGDETIGNYEDYTREIMTEIAISTSYNANRAENQQVMVDYVDNQKKSVSEVSIDEEMTNLIRYQHSYAAAAKLMSAIDEMIGTLINSIGAAGR